MEAVGNWVGGLVIPGDVLFPADETHVAGPGTYAVHGSIHSALAGRLFTSPMPDAPNALSVEVRRVGKGGGGGVQVPFVGAVVTGRVEVMTARFLKVSILCVESSVLAHAFSGELRREDVVERGKAAVVVADCFRPGDLVLARVISVGETASTFELSTGEAELGVVRARCPEDNAVMKPVSWKSIQCPDCDLVQPRKLAKVPDVGGK